MKFYDSPEAAYADTGETEAGTSIQFFDSPEAAFTSRQPAQPPGVLDIVREQVGQYLPNEPGPSVLDTARAQIAGDPSLRGRQEPGLLTGVAADVIANAPTETGVAMGMSAAQLAQQAAARGAGNLKAMTSPQALAAARDAAIRGARAGATRGPWGALIGTAVGGIGGGVLGNVLQEAQRRGYQQDQLLANPFQVQGANLIPRGVNESLWSMMGAFGVPGVANLFNRARDRLRSVWNPTNPGLRGTRAFTPQERMTMGERAQMFENAGVTRATMGELTDNPAMVDFESTMQIMPGVSQEMRGMLHARDLELEGLARGFAEDVAASGGRMAGTPFSPEMGYRRLVKGANDAVANIREARNQKVSPMYQRLWNRGAGERRIPVADMITEVEETAKRQSGGVQKVYQDFAKELREGMAPDGTVSAEKLHNMQSNQLSDAEVPGIAPNVKRAHREVGVPFRDRLERLVSGYGDARKAWRRYSRRIEIIEDETALGALIKDKANTVDIGNAARSIMRRDSLQGADVRQMLNRLRKNLTIDEYKRARSELTGAYMLDMVNNLNQIASAGALNVGGKLSRAFGGMADTAGGHRLRSITNALMTKPQQERFQQLLKAFDATAQVTRYGSPTAPRQRAMQTADIAELIDAGITEVTVGQGAGLMNWLLRNRPSLAQRFTGGGMGANEAYAHALSRGMNATRAHIDRLNRDIARTRLLPREAQESARNRLLGQFFVEALDEEEATD